MAIPTRTRQGPRCAYHLLYLFFFANRRLYRIVGRRTSLPVRICLDSTVRGWDLLARSYFSLHQGSSPLILTPGGHQEETALLHPHFLRFQPQEECRRLLHLRSPRSRHQEEGTALLCFRSPCFRRMEDQEEGTALHPRSLDLIAMLPLPPPPAFASISTPGGGYGPPPPFTSILTTGHRRAPQSFDFDPGRRIRLPPSPRQSRG